MTDKSEIVRQPSRSGNAGTSASRKPYRAPVVRKGPTLSAVTATPPVSGVT